MSCLGWFYVLMKSKGSVLPPPLSRAPPTRRAGPGPMWVRCRHRWQRPFISSLGRWTLHLINNQGNFSILQPVCGHRAGILLPLVLCQSLAALFRNPALHWTLFDRFACELWRRLFVRKAGDRSRELWVSTKTLVGSLFTFLDRLTFFVRRKSDGNATVQDSWEGWNCSWEARRGCGFTHQEQRTGKLDF